MKPGNFILALAAHLAEAGVADPVYEAARYVIDNPEVATDATPADAAEEWLSAAADAADWKDPARYGAS